MKMPKISISRMDRSRGVSVDFHDHIDNHFSIHMENFIKGVEKDFFGEVSNQRTFDIIERRIQSEISRLIQIGQLWQDIDGIWCMSCIDEVDNIGIKTLYKRNLHD